MRAPHVQHVQFDGGSTSLQWRRAGIAVLLLTVAVVTIESDLVPEQGWDASETRLAQGRDDMELMQGTQSLVDVEDGRDPTRTPKKDKALDNMRALKAYSVAVMKKHRSLKIKGNPLVHLIVKFGKFSKKNLVTEYAGTMGGLRRHYNGITGYVLRNANEAVMHSGGLVEYFRNKWSGKETAMLSFKEVGLRSRPPYFRKLSVPWSLYQKLKGKVTRASRNADSLFASEYMRKEQHKVVGKILKRITRRSNRKSRMLWKRVTKAAKRGLLTAWRGRKKLRPTVPIGISTAQKKRNLVSKGLRRPSKRNLRARAQRKARRWMRRHRRSLGKIVKSIERGARKKRANLYRRWQRKHGAKWSELIWESHRVTYPEERRFKAWMKKQPCNDVKEEELLQESATNHDSLRSQLLSEAALAGKAAAAAAARKGANSVQIRKAVNTAAHTVIWQAFLQHAKERAHAAAQLAVKIAKNRHLSRAAQDRAAKVAAANVVKEELRHAKASQSHFKQRMARERKLAQKRLAFATEVLDETEEAADTELEEAKPKYVPHGRRRRRSSKKAKKATKKAKAAKKAAKKANQANKAVKKLKAKLKVADKKAIAKKAIAKKAKTAKAKATKKAQAAKKAAKKADEANKAVKKLKKKAKKWAKKAKKKAIKAIKKAAKKKAHKKLKKKAAKKAAKAAKKAAKKAHKKLKKAARKAKKAAKKAKKSHKLSALKHAVKRVAKRVAKQAKKGAARTDLHKEIDAAAWKAVAKKVERKALQAKGGDEVKRDFHILREAPYHRQHEEDA